MRANTRPARRGLGRSCRSRRYLRDTPQVGEGIGSAGLPLDLRAVFSGWREATPASLSSQGQPDAVPPPVCGRSQSSVNLVDGSAVRILDAPAQHFRSFVLERRCDSPADVYSAVVERRLDA